MTSLLKVGLFFIKKLSARRELYDDTAYDTSVSDENPFESPLLRDSL